MNHPDNSNDFLPHRLYQAYNHIKDAITELEFAIHTEPVQEMDPQHQKHLRAILNDLSRRNRHLTYLALRAQEAVKAWHQRLPFTDDVIQDEVPNTR